MYEINRINVCLKFNKNDSFKMKTLYIIKYLAASGGVKFQYIFIKLLTIIVKGTEFFTYVLLYTYFEMEYYKGCLI